MTPPFAAIVAFAVLFGHPVLQIILIGSGARSFAVTPFGRIATYGSAAIAGALVAVALQRTPLAPPHETTPTKPAESKPAPTYQPTFRTLPREDEAAPAEGVVETPASNPRALDKRIVQRGDATVGSDIGPVFIDFNRVEIDKLAEVLKIIQSSGLSPSEKAHYPQGRIEDPKQISEEDLTILARLSVKIQSIAKLLEEHKISKVYMTTSAPRPNFTKGIDRKSGVPLAEDGDK